MLRGLAIQRVVLALAAMILLSGAVGAAVWTSPTRAPGRTSAPTTATTVPAPTTATTVPVPTTATTVPAPSKPPSVSATTAVPATSAPVPATSAVTHPASAPTFLANTGSEPDMALWALLLVILGGGLVWAEERSRLIALYRSPVAGRYRPRHSRPRS